MLKLSASFFRHFNNKNRLLIFSFVIISLVIVSGCITGQTDQPPTRTYSLADDGKLVIRYSPSPVSVSLIEKNTNYTLERLVFHTPHGDFYGLLGSPNKTKAGFIHAPGAGVTKEGHINRMKPYLLSGYSYLVLDIRGHGGETEGYPLNFRLDFQKFSNHEFPQYYDCIADMLEAAQYLRNRTHVPVTYIGESNGARYALIAAAMDPRSTGVIAVSTSGFDAQEMQSNGSDKKFLVSVDPGTYTGAISPRAVLVFHSEKDSIIPVEEGLKLYSLAKDPKEFVVFNGTHGINEETDRIILQRWAQLYHN